MIDKVDPDSSLNNGGKTDYYNIPGWCKTAQHIMRARNMNYAQGNIFKVAFTFNIGRHSATDYKRELFKARFFINEELERLEQENNNETV